MTVVRFMSFGDRELAIGDFVPGRERSFGETGSAERTSFDDEFADPDMFVNGRNQELYARIKMGSLSSM